MGARGFGGLAVEGHHDGWFLAERKGAALKLLRNSVARDQVVEGFSVIFCRSVSLPW